MLPAILAALGEAGAAGGGAAAAGGGGIAAALGGSEAAATIGQVTGSIQGLKGSLGDLLKPMGAVRFAAGKLYEGMNVLPDKIGEVQQMIVSTGQNWVKALAAPIDTVKQLGEAVGQFVRLANPASVVMFNYKIERAFATLGNILQPVFDGLSRAAETVGNVMARLKPALAPAMKAVEALIDLFAERFADLAEFVAPAIQMVSYAFLGLVKILEVVERPITLLIRGFNKLRAELYGLLGIPTGFDKDAKADFAVKTPNYTSAEQLQKEMAKNALMASAGGKAESEPQKQTSLLQEIRNFLAGWTPEAMKDKIVAAIREALPNLPDVPTPPGLEAAPSAVGGVASMGILGAGGAVYRAMRQGD